MRKGNFYPKLALGNLWRNKNTYLPYLLACVISIFTFYTMVAINTNGALNGMRGETIVKSFTAIGAFILAIFCSILIFYTNSFLIKRRKRELGLYSILGMEKKNIAVLLFFETFFIAALALLLGIGAGMLLSRLLFLVLLRMVQFPVALEMPISWQAVGITLALFGIVFLLTLLTNLRQVQMSNPITLMAGAKQGEKEPKASWLLTALGVLCLGGGYFIALYFQSPIEAIMFFLLAVFLVIVGTYCLFTSGSIAVLKLLRKNKNYYYRPKHFISVSGMLYRMKQNAAGLATICILSCMVLVTVSSTVSLNVGVEDSLLLQYPYEYTINFDDMQDGEQMLQAAQTIAAQQQVELTHLQDYRFVQYITQGENSQFTIMENTSAVTNTNQLTYVRLVPLEDYNKAENTQVTLAGNEALIFVEGGSYHYDTFTLNGVTYNVTPINTLGTEKAETPGFALTLTLVVPSVEAIYTIVEVSPENMPVGGAMLKREISFNSNGTPEAKQNFLMAYGRHINNVSTNAYFRYYSREDGRMDWYASNGGFLFLGIYFGVLFMLAAALIIYYKQISEGYDDADRFEILQKVGMSEQEVKKTINGQILMVFFLPLIVAVVHIAVAFWPISRAMVLFAVINVPLLALVAVATVLVYALLYMFVYRRTAKTYFKLVRRQTNG